MAADTGYDVDLPGDEAVDSGMACLLTIAGLVLMIRALLFF